MGKSKPLFLWRSQLCRTQHGGGFVSSLLDSMSRFPPTCGLRLVRCSHLWSSRNTVDVRQFPSLPTQQSYHCCGGRVCSFVFCRPKARGEKVVLDVKQWRWEHDYHSMIDVVPSSIDWRWESTTTPKAKGENCRCKWDHIECPIWQCWKSVDCIGVVSHRWASCGCCFFVSIAL